MESVKTDDKATMSCDFLDLMLMQQNSRKIS